MSPWTRDLYASLVTATLILATIVAIGPSPTGDAIEAGLPEWLEDDLADNPTRLAHGVLDGCINTSPEWPYVTINPDECA